MFKRQKINNQTNKSSKILIRVLKILQAKKKIKLGELKLQRHIWLRANNRNLRAGTFQSSEKAILILTTQLKMLKSQVIWVNIQDFNSQILKKIPSTKLNNIEGQCPNQEGLSNLIRRKLWDLKNLLSNSKRNREMFQGLQLQCQI